MQEEIDFVGEGYDAHCKDDEFIPELTNPVVSRLVRSARESQRVVPALSERPLVLSTAQKDGKSAYGQNAYSVAMFGSQELAELNASYLNGRGLKEGKYWDLTQGELEDLLKGKDNNALVRAVGLGGDALSTALTPTTTSTSTVALVG